MAQFWLPGDSDFALAMRGWPSSPNVKPQDELRLNTNSVLYNNLVLFYPLNEKSGQKVKTLIEGELKGILGSPGNYSELSYFGSSSLVWERGNPRLNDGSDDNAYLTKTSGSAGFDYILQEGPATIACRFKSPGFTSQGSSVNIIIEHGTLNNGIAIDSSQKIYAFARGSNSSVTSQSFNDDIFHTVAVSWSGSNAWFYVDGVLIDQFTPGSIGPSSSYGFTIGPSITTRSLVDSEYEWAAVWDSELDATKHALLAKGFWGLTKSANDAPYLISVPATGGTPTLSSPGVINVLSDRATPQVTLTF